MLIQQIGDLEGRPELTRVVAKGNEFLSAIKHSIVLLQIAKVGYYWAKYPGQRINC